MAKTKCDYMKCRRVADWVIETSYSPVCLCTVHTGINYLSIAAKLRAIAYGSEFELGSVKQNEVN